MRPESEIFVYRTIRMMCQMNHTEYFLKAQNVSNVSLAAFTHYNVTVDRDFQLAHDWFKRVEYMIDRYITSWVCVLGVTGNVINLFVLSQKCLRANMGRMEKCAHVGLMALAVSDLLYCAVSFPQTLMDRTSIGSPHFDLWVLYRTYSNAFINCFLVSSSWLTVSMAVCRYLAICHPIFARQYLGVTTSQTIVLLVFALSILFNLPRFWMKQVSFIKCVGEGRYYFTMPGYMERNNTAHVVYMWLYFILGILLPIIVLLYCNIYLIKALKVSNKLRKEHSTNSETTHVVTLTLSTIVILYIVLVGPAELVIFWKPFVTENPLKYGIALRICNALQMWNFAINFILYCIINVQYRLALKNMICPLRTSFRALRNSLQTENGNNETRVMLDNTETNTA